MGPDTQDGRHLNYLRVHNQLHALVSGTTCHFFQIARLRCRHGWKGVIWLGKLSVASKRQLMHSRRYERINLITIPNAYTWESISLVGMKLKMCSTCLAGSERGRRGIESPKIGRSMSTFRTYINAGRWIMWDWKIEQMAGTFGGWDWISGACSITQNSFKNPNSNICSTENWPYHECPQAEGGQATLSIPSSSGHVW